MPDQEALADVEFDRIRAGRNCGRQTF
jgi:hypothetical protein